MSHNKSKYVVCPYFKGTEWHKIYCEGIISKAATIFAFEDAADMKKHIRDFCENIDNYDNCRICDMLNLKHAMEDE